MATPRFLDLIERRRREFLCLVLVMTVLFYGIHVPHLFDGANPHVRFWLPTLINSYFGMAMILTLVGWSRALLNHDSPALRYANTAVYPFYIVHQTITVLLGYALINWPAPFAVKFPLLFAGTFLGSWLIYEAVRRNRVSRLLFGISKGVTGRRQHAGAGPPLPGREQGPA